MRETLDRMAGGVPHQGIIAIVSEKPVLSLPTLLDAVKAPALLVALDGVEDPRNLGAILRTAEAAGADGVLLPERHSAGLSETVARASAGALEHVPVARVGNLVQALQALKERGVWIVGYDAAGTERWDAVDLTKPVALVLGGEGRGMRRLVREHCDHLVSIPHFGHVTSLNVSVAAGVALYEAVRQRGAVPSVVRPIPREARRARSSARARRRPRRGRRRTAHARTRGHAWRDADGSDGEAEDDFDGPAIPHVDFHEDVAWGRGPTVLKAIDFHTARRPGDRDRVRRGKGKRGRPRPQRPRPRRAAGPRAGPTRAASASIGPRRPTSGGAEAPRAAARADGSDAAPGAPAKGRRGAVVAVAAATARPAHRRAGSTARPAASGAPEPGGPRRARRPARDTGGAPATAGPRARTAAAPRPGRRRRRRRHR